MKEHRGAIFPSPTQQADLDSSMNYLGMVNQELRSRNYKSFIYQNKSFFVRRQLVHGPHDFLSPIFCHVQTKDGGSRYPLFRFGFAPFVATGNLLWFQVFGCTKFSQLQPGLSMSLKLAGRFRSTTADNGALVCAAMPVKELLLDKESSDLSLLSASKPLKSVMEDMVPELVSLVSSETDWFMSLFL